MKSLIASCFIAAAFSTCVAAVASAGPGDRYQRSARVFVGDLNLATEHDARELYERIGYAARSVCRGEVLGFDQKRQRHRKECIEATITSAVNRVGAPLLTAIHLQQREQVARL